MGLRRETDQHTPPAPPTLPDDRLVPVLVAIWGLAVYVGAIDCLILHPEAAELQRRWPWTAGLVAALASVLSIAVVTISPHRLRRSMLLALCMSLVINLTVVIGLSYIHIASRPLAARSTPSPPEPPEEEPSPTEYLPLNMDEQEMTPPAERQPVPTGQPELEPRELPRPSSTAATVPLPERADSLPEPRPRPSTATVARQELLESAPRRFEWQSMLSRQPLSAQPSLGRADAETYLVPREAIDLAPREANSPLPRQAESSPEHPATIEQPEEAAAAVPAAEAPPRAAAENLASVTPPSESLRRPEPRGALPSTAVLPRSALPDSHVDPVPRGDERSEVPLTPRTARLSPRSTSPAMGPQADAEFASSSPRLEPPKSPQRASAAQLPAMDSRIAPSTSRPPLSSAVSPAPSQVEIPQPSPTSNAAGGRANQPQPLPLESAIGARSSEPVLPAGDADAMPREVGSATAIEPAPVERVARREQPELGTLAREQLSTNRSRPGGVRPAIESRVERPEVAIQAPAANAPTASAASINQRPTANAAAMSVPDGPAPAGPSAAPDSLSTPEVVRPARSVAAASETPSRLTSPATSLPRAEPLRDAPPSARPDTLVSQIAGDRGVGAADERADQIAQPAVDTGRARASLGAEVGTQVDSPSPDASVTGTGEPTALSSPGRAPPSPAADLVRRNSGGDSGPPAAQAALASPAAPPGRSRLAVAPSVNPSVGGLNASDEIGGSPSESGTPQPAQTEARARGSDIVRRSTGAVPVDVEAGEGVGGLSNDIPTDVGLTHRSAQPESQQVADNIGRFLRRPLSGPPAIDTQVPIPARAYETRMNRRGDASLGGNGRPSARTEAAIELGLTYLAAQQQPNGSWRLANNGEAADVDRRLSIESDSAASGLALLSFLGAGYHHRSEHYGDVVSGGLEFLINHQQPSGDLYIPADSVSNESAWLYSHAIASIALCEAYGMTQDPALRAPAQRAVDFIVESQHPQRGGWRYEPRVGSDTSVSGWMVMALRSGELANLSVPRDVWQRVDGWLDMAQASERRPELYRYNPLAPDTLSQGHGRQVTKSMTAVGLLMRMYTGWRRDDQEMIAGAEYLLNNLPDNGTARGPERDTYYWYYATQVMFHMRGQYWERWNGQLHELLTSTQQQAGELAGSWDPWSPLPDRWAPHAGRLYVTTMNLLSLEVYYRHLPIYEDTAR